MYPVEAQQMEKHGSEKEHCLKNSPGTPLSQIPYSFIGNHVGPAFKAYSSITPFPHRHSGAANGCEGKWT